jgi:hypothetical protein
MEVQLSIMNHNSDVAHYSWLQCMTMTMTHGQSNLDNVGGVVHVFKCVVWCVTCGYVCHEGFIRHHKWLEYDK